jgi:hypothetical protein
VRFGGKRRARCSGRKCEKLAPHGLRRVDDEREPRADDGIVRVGEALGEVLVEIDQRQRHRAVVVADLDREPSEVDAAYAGGDQLANRARTQIANVRALRELMDRCDDRVGLLLLDRRVDELGIRDGRGDRRGQRGVQHRHGLHHASQSGEARVGQHQRVGGDARDIFELVRLCEEGVEDAVGVAVMDHELDDVLHRSSRVSQTPPRWPRPCEGSGRERGRSSWLAHDTVTPRARHRALLHA